MTFQLGKLLNFSCATVFLSIPWDCLEDYVSFSIKSIFKSFLHIASTMLLLAIVTFEIPGPFGEEEKDIFLRAMGNVSLQDHSSHCLSSANAHSFFWLHRCLCLAYQTFLELFTSLCFHRTLYILPWGSPIEWIRNCIHIFVCTRWWAPRRKSSIFVPVSSMWDIRYVTVSVNIWWIRE